MTSRPPTSDSPVNGQKSACSLDEDEFGKNVSVSAYTCLADLCLAHLSFVARYEQTEPGLVEIIPR